MDQTAADQPVVLKPPDDWRIVLEEYKTLVVPDVHSALQARSDEAKQTKTRIKELALRINAEKRAIDQLTTFQKDDNSTEVRLQCYRTRPRH